jgi:GNAT superfamily N-acetyltransferase
MLKIENIEIKHLREVVRVGIEYYEESRFNKAKDLPLDHDVIHDVAKTCIVSPNVLVRGLFDEDGKLHGFVQAALVPIAWNKRMHCVVNLIYVDKCCKGHDYGKQFLDNVKEWAKANNCYELVAGDDAFDPEATGKWLVRQGYKKVGSHYAIKI